MLQMSQFFGIMYEASKASPFCTIALHFRDFSCTDNVPGSRLLRGMGPNFCFDYTVILVTQLSAPEVNKISKLTEAPDGLLTLAPTSI
jgi:hypothetical protein